MNSALVDGVVKAVLYEGYMLYPYRPSAVKNRQRFNFGVVYPREYSESQNSGDAWTMQTECPVLANQNTECVVRVRFLRMVDRRVMQVISPSPQWDSITPENIVHVERLEVDGKVFQSWQEALEETIEIEKFNLSALATCPMQRSIQLCAKALKEPIRDEHGLVVGLIELHSPNIEGTIDLEAVVTRPGVFKLKVKVSNESRVQNAGEINRERALTQSLVSSHTIMEVTGGEFVSLVDPPEKYSDVVRDCQNIGTWPVLVGEEGDRSAMLSSPIILYDYPQIAPESPGDLFDGAEIDEILSLRILTMTDDEKREMRQSDDRARQILERTESLPEEYWTKLHGALRGLHREKEERP